jgi:hypothetical protein
MGKPQVFTAWHAFDGEWAITIDGDDPAKDKEFEFVERSAYVKALALINWLRDGIQHFNSEEDESQRDHLTNHINETLRELGEIE